MLTREEFEEKKIEVSESNEKLKKDIDRLNEIVSVVDRYLNLSYDDADFEKKGNQIQEEVEKLDDLLEIVEILA